MPYANYQPKRAALKENIQNEDLLVVWASKLTTKNWNIQLRDSVSKECHTELEADLSKVSSRINLEYMEISTSLDHLQINQIIVSTIGP